MKRSVNITITLGLILLTLSGCSKTDNFLVENNFIKNLTKTYEERLHDKFEKAIEDEIELIQLSFNDKFILSTTEEPIFIPYKEDALIIVSTITKDMKADFETGTYKKKSNQELLNSYVYGAKTNINELTNTINVYDKKFEDSIIKIKNSFTQKDYFYIEKMYNNQEDNKKLNIDTLIKSRIAKDFFKKYELHSRYFQTINNSLSFVKRKKIYINDYVYDRELADYLKRLNKHNNTNLTHINDRDKGELYYKALHDNFNPIDNTLYDLGGFKVFQSLNNGVLLIPNASYQYRTKHMIFIRTSKSFVDNNIFKYGQYKIAKVGIKKYSTILGATKSVYSFKLITDVDKSIYHYSF